MQVGTTKDQGLYNKPLAAVHPGALVAGTLLQYNTGLLPCRSGLDSWLVRVTFGVKRAADTPYSSST